MNFYMGDFKLDKVSASTSLVTLKIEPVHDLSDVTELSL